MLFSFKKSVTALSIAALVMTSSAARLVVDDDGLGSDYATIALATADANKGDTIIITKKNAGDWHENISITKGMTLLTQDLTIKNYGTITINTADTVVIDSLTNIGDLTYTDGTTGNGTLLMSDLMLTGGVTYTARGTTGLMQISNSAISGAIGTATATTAGSTVRVIASNTGSITTGVNYKLDLYSSIAGQVSYADGDVIGNQVTAITVIAGGSTTKTKIIGNNITGLSSANNAITYLPLVKSVDVLNNKIGGSGYVRTGVTVANRYIGYSNYAYTQNIYETNGTSTWTYTSRTANTNLSGYGFDSTYTVTGTGIPNEKAVSIEAGSYTGIATINHNYFNLSSTGSSYGVYATLGTTGQVLFNHNAFKATAAGGYMYSMLSVTGGYSLANYNFGDNANTSYYQLTGVTDKQGNAQNDTVYTDKGNPDPFYNDVDGSRANIGYEGGAFPYSSFNRTGRITTASQRKPQVVFVEAPRKIRPGQAITVKATGIAN